MLRIAAAQLAPVFLDAAATTEKIIETIATAGRRGIQVLAFPETFLPGYPFWLELTAASEFESSQQKEAYAAYLDAAVTVEGPEVSAIVDAAREAGVYTVLGIAERCRGSIFATLVPISPEHGVLTPHRKLVPTYEERLVWAPGDGHGLRVHEHAGIKISGLNCWENWMPQARNALYAAGSELHVALWPGAPRNTVDITRFVAREGRVFVLSASGILRLKDIPHGFPLADKLPDVRFFRDGGSAVAAPGGRWLVEPVVGEEQLVVAEIDPAEVRRQRLTFDPTGHYSRPDVFDVRVDRRRRQAVHWDDEPAT